MKLFVNSGNMITDNGRRFFPGDLVPDEIVNGWTTEIRDRMLEAGTVIDGTPTLDPVIDARDGSAAIPTGQQAPEKEKFSSRQLGKEIADKHPVAEKPKAKRGRPPKKGNK